MDDDDSIEKITVPLIVVVGMLFFWCALMSLGALVKHMERSKVEQTVQLVSASIAPPSRR